MRATFILVAILISSLGCKNATRTILVKTYGGGSYGAAVKEELCKKFEVEGVNCKQRAWGANYMDFKNQVVASDINFNVLDIPSYLFEKGKSENLFERINWEEKVTNYSGSIDEFGIGNVYWSTVLSYNKEETITQNSTTLTNGIKGWKDYFDISSYPGNRGIYDSPVGNLEIALIADGISLDSIYIVLSKEEGIDRAFDKLSEIKNNITFWYEDAGLAITQLEKGSIIMSPIWNGRLFSNSSKKIEFIWNEAITILDYWVIPKGAKNIKESTEFVLYAVEAENQGRLINKIGYGPSNSNSFKFIDTNILDALPTSKNVVSSTLQLDAKWWDRNEDRMNERWIVWKNK